MKIISWNCNGALRKKYNSLERFNADLWIIQECENPSESTKAFKEWASNYLWLGENKNRGIGIFAFSDIKLEKLPWNDNNLQSFLPCKVNGSLNLIAVWTKHAKSPNFRYIGQLWKYMQLHKKKMKNAPFILVGDWNSNTCWDEWDRWWNHSDVVKELNDLGAYSIYHQFYNEEQGKESRPTLYHLRNRKKPYHVDYAFISKQLLDKNDIYIGDADEWLEFSDHMPLVFSINN